MILHVQMRGAENNSFQAVHAGKAGGFLALDWNDSSPVGPLARLSYALHRELAQTLGVDTGYREVRTFSVAASAKPGDPQISLCSADADCVFGCEFVVLWVGNGEVCVVSEAMSSLAAYS
jgi:hypothetical protein